MFKSCLVSIIMPAYNCANYIKGGIQSVLEQSYQNWELLIVNDCSTDDTLDAALSIDDSRIHISTNSINLGVSKSRNIAINMANGQYIAFLDSDDLWLPEKLAQQIEALKSDKHAVCCHSSYARINEVGKLLSTVRCVNKIGLSLMRKGNFIGNLTGVIDRERIGTVYQKQVRHEDYVMWLDILSRKANTYSIGVTEVLAKYRVGKASISSNKLQSIGWHWAVLRQEQGLALHRASYYLLHYMYYALKKRQ